jgi:phosphonate transport system ATP-binding protein
MSLVLQACSGRHPAAKTGARAALHQLSLAVASGEQLAVIGPSGAGKTTLLLLMACALRPAQGELQIDGRNPWRLSTRALQDLRSGLFLAPQVPPLPPRQRVVSAVLAGRLPEMGLWRSLRSLIYPLHIDLAEAALARFNIADKLFERVDRLSGGERQRVGLARLVASSAKLLLVDEPLSALDPERSRQALQSLTDTARERGATLVATLHHVKLALQYFPRIVGLREGELAFDLPATEVTPEHLRELYASHLEELTGPAPEMDFSSATPAPVAMQCR